MSEVRIRQGFHGADLAVFTDLYNLFAPANYHIDADLLDQRTVESRLFDWGASCFMNGDAFVAVKRSAHRLYRGPNQDVAHINILAFNDPKEMLLLMREVKACLRDRGLSTLQFGADSGHFFPGCPVDFHSLRDFLIIGGFAEGGEAHDLERDMPDYEYKGRVPEGNLFRACSEADLPQLREFLTREFPGRWTYDVNQKLEAEKDPSTVFGLFQSDGRCDGFALLQREGCKQPIGGAVWRNCLGPKWGSLGPIGVSKAIRGQGCGGALLGKALEYQRDAGVQRCIIDWTGLVEFYGKQGFEVTRTYRYMTLDLELPE